MPAPRYDVRNDVNNDIADNNEAAPIGWSPTNTQDHPKIAKALSPPNNDLPAAYEKPLEKVLKQIQIPLLTQPKAK
jgi:hypothetical protein